MIVRYLTLGAITISAPSCNWMSSATQIASSMSNTVVGIITSVRPVLRRGVVDARWIGAGVEVVDAAADATRIDSARFVRRPTLRTVLPIAIVGNAPPETTTSKLDAVGVARPAKV